MEDKCIYCGKCCHWKEGDKIMKCKFLIKIGQKFWCRIYKNRIGKLIHQNKESGINRFCVMRKNAQWDYKGCPYNTDKPMAEW